MIGGIVVTGVALIVLSRGGAERQVVFELAMPALAQGAEEGTVDNVLKQAGDRVTEGDTIFEVSASERSAEVRSPVDGVVVAVAAQVGQTFEVGKPLGQVQTGPAIGDHWHGAFGVNVCGTWLPNIGEFTADFHSHGDGLIHAHPRSMSDSGDNATLGRFFSRAGGSLSDQRLRYPGGDTYVSGKVDCGDEKGVLRWALNGEEQEGGPADVVVTDGDVFAIAFIPEGEEIPATPPSAGALAGSGAQPKPPGFEEEPPAPEGAPAENTETSGP